MTAADLKAKGTVPWDSEELKSKVRLGQRTGRQDLSRGVGRGSREQVVGLEEPISLESAGGVTRPKWVGRQWGGGHGRSREMGRGEAIECAGGLCTGNSEWLIAVILSAKNWRNELQVFPTEQLALAATR